MADIKFLQINGVEKWDKPLYNDIEFATNNDIIQVNNNDYVAQIVAKVLRTDKNSSVPFPNYGTTLSQIRKSIVNNSLLESQVANDIISAISYVRTLEESPSTSEQIAGISDISVETIDMDKFTKAVSVTLSIVTKNGETTTVTV